MRKVAIQLNTTHNPLALMGYEAGVCWGTDVSDYNKNVNRGIECIESGHMRVSEFPQIYLTIKGFSAKCIREFYTHIGGSPTRLQASTRYIDYSKDYDYITPPSIEKNEEAKSIYEKCMNNILKTMQELKELGVPKEDYTMALPICYETIIVDRTNLRQFIEMCHLRECSRAYWEFRLLIKMIKEELSKYSQEWKYIVDHYCKPKCEEVGFCTEKYSCGRMPKKEE